MILLLLTTLRDRVVNNSSVSKTLKVQLFNQTSLRQLCKVLSWNGLKKTEKEFTEDDLGATSTAEERAGVRDAVLHFLIAVCASTKHGIVFHDPAFGTSAKNANHVLTDLLRTLTVSSPYHRELARRILIAAPDQIVHFLPSWKPAFVPRASEKWTDLMSWLASVYSSMDIVEKVRKIPGKSRVPLALSLILPTILDLELQTDAFADKQPVTVSIVFLKFLRSVVSRVFKVSLIFNGEERKQFLDGCREKIIPPDIISTHLLKSLHASPSEDIGEWINFLVLFPKVFQLTTPLAISDSPELTGSVNRFLTEFKFFLSKNHTSKDKM